MGLLDDAIREHLELKRQRGADAEEVARQESEALGPPRGGTFARPAGAQAEAAPDELAYEDEPLESEEFDDEPLAPSAAAAGPVFADDEPWLDEPDEVPADEGLDPQRTVEFTPPDVEPADELVGPDQEPAGEDVLEETPDFLQETPEHDRLWFEQRPPRGFDFDK